RKQCHGAQDRPEIPESSPQNSSTSYTDNPISARKREGSFRQPRYWLARERTSVCRVRVIATKQFLRSSSISAGRALGCRLCQDGSTLSAIPTSHTCSYSSPLAEWIVERLTAPGSGGGSFGRSAKPCSNSASSISPPFSARMARVAVSHAPLS